MEFSEDFSTSNDQTISVIKRKRTKRPRPASSTSSAVDHFRNSPSPTSSTGLSTTTTEEEDIAASCLILLARGNSPPPLEEETKSAERKSISSRKFTEMSITSDGKVGMYVYECKTCDRTFPSFQALGGHRASHKKPKTADSAPDRKLSPVEKEKDKEKEVTATKTTVMPLANRIGYLDNSTKGKDKVHECSICGAKFGSGQALGGHMRRHRSALVTAKVETNVDSDTLSREASEKSQNAFALDLNFPPEEEVARSDESFRMFLADQQTRLVLSTAY